MRRKVEKISCIAHFIRFTYPDEVRVGLLTSDHQGSLYSTARRENSNDTSKFVHVGMNVKTGRVFAIAVSAEEREKELNDINYADNWKKKIPKNFFGGAEWKEGTPFD